MAELMRKRVVQHRIGAYLVDGEDVNYYLVHWEGRPYLAEKDTVIQNGEISFSVKQGEWLCKGKWLFHVTDADNWYFVKENADYITVRMQQVVSADVRLLPVGDGNRLPPSCDDGPRRSYIERKYKPMKILDVDHDFLMDRAAEMEDWDHFEVTAENDPDGCEDSNCEDGYGSVDDD